MSSEAKLPWPGYRLRDGWGVVSVGEILRTGDVCRGEDNGTWVTTRRVGLPVLHNGEPYFRQTDPNATIPPVEPIPVAKSKDQRDDDVQNALAVVSDTIAELTRTSDKWHAETHRLQNVLLGVESERDDLKKHVETLTEKCSVLASLNESLRDQVNEFREANAKSAKARINVRDWRAELRPCLVQFDRKGPWEQCWHHGDRGVNEHGELIECVEQANGRRTAGPYSVIFIDPTKEPQS